jgi:acyl carrier protein
MDATARATKTGANRVAIKDWIVSYLSDALSIPATDIDPTVDMDRFGLNSAAAVSMMGAMEDWLGLELSPALLFDYPTIDAISGHLQEELRKVEEAAR